MPLRTLLFRALAYVALVFVTLPGPARAQDALQPALQAYVEDLVSPSRRTIEGVVTALIAEGHPNIGEFLRRYSAREVVQRPEDGLFFYAEDAGALVRLVDIDSGEAVAEVSSRDVTQIRTNSGVQRVIAAALVPLELNAPEPERRMAALDAISRSPDASQIAPLAESVERETDAGLKTRKERLLLLLQAQFAEERDVQLAAIEALGGDISIEARGVLSRLTATQTEVAPTLPESANVARVLEVGADLTEAAAYDLLVSAGLAEPAQTPAMLREVLAQNIVDGRVGGVPVGRLSDPAARIEAYEALEAAGTVPPRAAPDEAAPGHRRLSGGRSGVGWVVAGLDLFPCRHRVGDHLRRDGRDQHGAWRIYHDGRLYGLCRAIVHPRLHD